MAEYLNNRIQAFHRDGTSPRLLKARVSAARSLAFHPDGDLMALSSKGTVFSLDLEGNINSQFEVVGATCLAIDNKGNIVITNERYHQVMWYTKAGVLIKKIGSLGGFLGQFYSPKAVAVDLRGNIIVGEAEGARVQILDPEGTPIRAFGEGEVTYVSGVSVDQHGKILVTDLHSMNIKIFNMEGKVLQKIKGQIRAPKGTAIDHDGNILVASSEGHCIQVYG